MATRRRRESRSSRRRTRRVRSDMDRESYKKRIATERRTHKRTGSDWRRR